MSVFSSFLPYGLNGMASVIYDGIDATQASPLRCFTLAYSVVASFCAYFFLATTATTVSVAAALADSYWASNSFILASIAASAGFGPISSFAASISACFSAAFFSSSAKMASIFF